MKLTTLTLLLLSFIISHSSSKAANHDVVIYGGTSSAVIAAVQAKRLNKSVVIVCPNKHLGGLSSGGLGFTDTGDKSVIGGLSREFYHRVWQQYQTESAWKWQKKSDYGNKGQGTPAIDGENRTQWIFEPHIAEQVFEAMIAENKIEVHREHWLDRTAGVVKNDGRIVSIQMLNGARFQGKMFIDATYEGDLLAAAGVAYTLGREANATYGENWNGNQVGVLHHRHHFGAVPKPISPYKTAGDPTSGLLPLVDADPPGQYGAADNRIQAYCYRTCLTQHPENRIPFPKPEGYDAGRYELLLRVFEAGWRETFAKFDPIPNLKTDTNNHGPVSFDNIGMNYDYPEGSYERRRKIAEEHRRYQQGLLYFVANDPRVPEDVRSEMAKWGLAKDEFVDNDHWSHEMYIREARRMIGKHVMTELELTKARPTPESIGMGSYTIDSHNVRRYVTAEGFVQNEGDIGVSTHGPYEIALGSILPKREQCENLIVPVCVSSTHIAFGSIRMEPVFMILGQSASTVASMAIDGACAVQEVTYESIKQQLIQDGQVLESDKSKITKAKVSSNGKPLEGIVVDDRNAILTGNWTHSSANQPYVGVGYQHNGNINSDNQTAVFETSLEKVGTYEVRMAYPANANRASNISITVEHVGGKTIVNVGQKVVPPNDGQTLTLGKFRFDASKPARVTIGCKDTDGYVVIDAVQWIRIE